MVASKMINNYNKYMWNNRAKSTSIAFEQYDNNNQHVYIY